MEGGEAGYEEHWLLKFCTAGNFMTVSAWEVIEDFRASDRTWGSEKGKYCEGMDGESSCLSFKISLSMYQHGVSWNGQAHGLLSCGLRFETPKVPI